ncbi:MAG TPA: hypothetical protein VKT24_03925 [Rhizomicrobium sp.]|nr:hypothetical protein [Rhizomicrobium sp.]
MGVFICRIFGQRTGDDLSLFLDAGEPLVDETHSIGLHSDDACDQHDECERVEQDDTARKRGKTRTTLHARHG